MDGDPAFGAGAFDVVDVEPRLPGPAQRRLGGVVFRRPLLPPPLTQLHRLVGSGKPQLFRLVAGGGAHFLGAEFRDLFGDLATGDALAPVAATISAAAAAAASTAGGELAERADLSQRLVGSFAHLADRFAGATADVFDGAAGPFADVFDRPARAFADIFDRSARAFADVLDRSAGPFADVLDRALGALSHVFDRAAGPFADLSDGFIR